MGEFFYSQALNRVEITQTNLQAMLDDIDDRVNTDLHDREQFRNDSVRYKHFKVPFRIFASSEFVGQALFPGTVDNGGVNWNWTNAQIKHVQSVGNAPNIGDSGHPVIHLMGQMVSHDWEPGAYEIGLGYSINNGSTFTYWPNTNAFFGTTRARRNPLWSAETTHYHDGVVDSYWPGSMYGKREAHCVLGAADFGVLDITTITDWALGIRVNYTTSNGNGSKDVHDLDIGKLTLIARDIT